MCGILGVIRVAGVTREDLWSVRAMADALAHRGPDGEGFHVEPYAAIGMRRLSIIDLSGGWQPLYNEDRSIVVIANGEIYNFVELRKELIARGHRFSSGSDSETIVHLYEDHGEDCVHRLRGMFAFAVLDIRKRKLVIARDRMGEKPLVYHESGGCLTFCSEVSGLVASGRVAPSISPDAAKSYFHWQFVPEPMTALKGVQKLDAGCLLSIDLANGRKNIRRYWSLSDAPVLQDSPVERIRAELEEVGKLTSRSDVPIGVGLSGGIDSSAIAVLAQRHSAQPVTAITIGYEGLTWQDERALARKFAEYINMPLIEHRISDRDVVDDFPGMCLRRDDPINDISGSSFDALYKVAHESGHRVLLGGHGGDELFWGYPWYRTARSQTIRKQLRLAHGAGIFDYLRLERPPLSITGFMDWMADAGGLLRGIREFRRDAVTNPNRAVFWDLRKEFRLAQSTLQEVAGEQVRGSGFDVAANFIMTGSADQLDVFLTQLMCDTFLQSNGMILCDRLSMGARVEGRLPLVDYRLAEVVVGLRKNQTDADLGHKSWLIDAMRGLVPEFVFARPKRGFTPPWRRWTKALHNAYGPDLLDGELVRQGILSPRGAARLRSGMSITGQQIPFAMSALVLEQWSRGMKSVYEGTAQHRGLAAQSSDPILPPSTSKSHTPLDLG
jgi:asparagine synthase (glutamine-hydrolysing)